MCVHTRTLTHKCTGYISRRASVFLLFSLANTHAHTAHRGCQRRWLRGVLSKQRSLKKRKKANRKKIFIVMVVSVWGEIEVWTRCRKDSRPYFFMSVAKKFHCARLYVCIVFARFLGIYFPLWSAF